MACTTTATFPRVAFGQILIDRVACTLPQPLRSAVTWGYTTVARPCVYQLRVLHKHCACRAGIRPCTCGVAPAVYRRRATSLCLVKNLRENPSGVSARAFGCFPAGCGLKPAPQWATLPPVCGSAAAAGSAQHHSCACPNPSLVAPTLVRQGLKV